MTGGPKYIHADGFAPMLYDLASDPQDFQDLGRDPTHAENRARFYNALAKWSPITCTQTTVSSAVITRSDKAAWPMI